MYYNDVIKQAYLATLSRRDQRNRANKMFDTAKALETDKQKDLGLWNHDEVVWLINQLATIDLVTLKTQILDAYAYQRWYLKEIETLDANEDTIGNVACNQKKIVREDIDFDKAVRKNLIPDFSAVCASVSAVVAFDEGVLTPPLLCFAWMNIDIEDALSVPSDGVQWGSNMIFKASGEVLVERIPAEVVEVLRQYANTWVGKNGRKTVYPYDTGYFLKPFVPRGYVAPCEPTKANTAMSAIARVNQKIQQAGLTDFDITYTNVQKSAQFKMMLDREPASFLSPEGRQFVEKLCGNGQKDFQKSRIYDVLYMYEQYKKVFKLD